MNQEHGHDPEPGNAAGHGNGGAAAGSPWEKHIDVYLERAGDNPKFRLDTDLPIDPNGNIIFENNHRPGFNITFKLIDETAEGYLFPPQAYVDKACWSQKGGACPSQQIHEIFEPKRVSHDGERLFVYNDNPSPPHGAFKYTLRVTKDGGMNYCDLDPGGVDRNGPRV